MPACLRPTCLLLLTGLVLAAPIPGRAQVLTGPQTDSLVALTMRTFDVPGVALAVVKDGRVVLEKGYGVRVAGRPGAVDAHTLFSIASCSKAFTAAALGILVDEGKLRWDDKVIDHLPDFRLADPWVTADFTVRDLLTHRSGLGPNAGDLMRVTDSAQFTVPEVVHNLRYLPLRAPFRSGFAYDNVLYLVAGELVAKVSGLSWDDFVEQRLLAPLHMPDSRAAYRRINLKKNPNVVLGHRPVQGRLRPLPGPTNELDAGAGGLYSSAADLSGWMLAQLGGGQAVGGRRVFSAAVGQEMWTPQTIIPASKDGVYNTHFAAYGLGWFLVDERGYKVVFHTGQDEGQVSEIVLVPELNLGITVLTNQEAGGAVQALAEQLLDGYLGLHRTNRVQEWASRVQAPAQVADTTAAAVWREATRRHAQKPPLSATDIGTYAGTYRDPWLGDVQVYPAHGSLWLRVVKSPQLRGPLLPYRGNTFVVRWTNPAIQADAFVTFALDPQGRASAIALRAVSPATPVSYDFQDLDLRRVAQ